MSDPVARRAAGKMEVVRRTVWLIEAGPLRMRCLKNSDGYVSEISVESGRWKRLANVVDPHTFLERFVASDQMKMAIAIASERANR